jgi:hypothetical protein
MAYPPYDSYCETMGKRQRRAAALAFYGAFLAGSVAAGFYLPTGTGGAGSHQVSPATTKIVRCVDSDAGQLCESDARPRSAVRYAINACISSGGQSCNQAHLREMIRRVCASPRRGSTIGLSNCREWR